MAEPDTQGTGLTFLGRLVSVILILGLIALGAYVVMRANQPKPGQPMGTGPAAPSSPAKSAQPAAESTGPEAADLTGVTTVREYKFIAAERLPAVKGVSQYK